jgi:hypothetical protein
VRNSGTPRHRNLVPGTQTAALWVDESGSRTTANDCFVVAALKTRQSEKLQRDVRAIRETHSFDRELKFGRVSDHSLKVYNEVIDLLADSNVRVAATVVDGSVYNPFREAKPWRAQAHVIARLVQGNVNRNEIVTVFMDHVTTPAEVAMGDVVKREVNSKIGATAVVEAVSLDSKSNDLLQVADLLAGAIFYQRLKTRDGRGNAVKHSLGRRLAFAFEQPDLRDVRTARINISTLAQPRDRHWATRTGTGASASSRDARR